MMLCEHPRPTRLWVGGGLEQNEVSLLKCETLDIMRISVSSFVQPLA
jgi:hypothetical protein